MPAGDQVPAGRVDSDLVDEVVEEDDVAAALRHLRRLAAPGQMDELVDQHLERSRGWPSISASACSALT